MVVVILLDLILVATYLVLNRYVIVNWHLYPRNQKTLDLCAQTLSVQDYKMLSWRLPDTDIRWNVPFQDKYLSSDVQELTLTQLDDDTMKFNLNTPNVNNGWRQLDNYKAMRDLIGVFI